MPAYFLVDFQYKRSELKESTFDDFIRGLQKCGLEFESGYWHSKTDSLEEISKWNINKLMSDYELGYNEHYSHDYKQCLFKFSDFEEARLYIMNHPEEESFSFHLIIPEDDFIEYCKQGKKMEIKHRVDRMEMLEQFAIQMWETGYMNSIQTGWECSDCSTSAKDIERGISPLVEPFAIVSKGMYREKWDFEVVEIARNGVLLRNDENWLYM